MMIISSRSPLRNPLFQALALLGLLICSASCSAHQKWLWPNVFVAEKTPVWISFDVTWSDTPFVAERGVGDRPLNVIHPGGRSESPARLLIGKTKSTAEIELTEEGTYRLESIDPLTYWTRVEKNGEEKWLKQSKNEVKDPSLKITRSDLYWSKAVAFVSVGKTTSPPTIAESEPLQVTLGAHPSQLVSGNTYDLAVVSYGKPVANADVKVFVEGSTGHDPQSTIRCNEVGTGKLKISAAGRHLLSCELEQKVSDDPKADVHSFNFYMTLLVKTADR